VHHVTLTTVPLVPTAIRTSPTGCWPQNGGERRRYATFSDGTELGTAFPPSDTRRDAEDKHALV
jgi:hypothetical protein